MTRPSLRKLRAINLSSTTGAVLLIFLLLSLTALADLPPTASPESAHDPENFDAGWRFLKTDATGADQRQCDDSEWRQLSVPHDWSIEGPFAETNQTGGAGGFLPSGVAWYRKHFTLPDSDSAKSVFIEFDGVMANSDVWINGFHSGHRPYGYVSFAYELTGHLNFGGDNVIAVRTDTSAQPASRWYAGAGIYRHVRLVVIDKIHIEDHSVLVIAPQVSTAQATVKIDAVVTNESDSPREITLETKLVSPTGETAATVETTGTIAGDKTIHFQQQIVLPRPQLWNLDDPRLYHTVSAVRAGDTILDEQTTAFGIRDAHFEADTGFWLNGKNFKIKGVCLHADGGAFGAAIPVSIWEARLKTLKSLGVNAIRTAHNPPAPEFLDLCDRMGFLVMDEMFDCWTVGKNSFDYHLYFKQWSQTDERDTILRDRNHPSVILYSVGNEIHDTPQAETAKRILTGLVAVAHAADSTRRVTQALFRPNASHDYDDGLADLLDVIGQNYRENEILAAHEAKPTRKILGTENTHDRKQWTAMRDHPAYAGQFLWTGVDYLGESRRWPLVGHSSGLLDRTGAPRPVAFERQSWWSDQPMVFLTRRLAPTDAMPVDPGYAADERYSQVLFADWTPKNLQPHNENVEVYSNCKEVELFLNGQSLGVKTIHADASSRNWQVSFAPGVLQAVGHNDDQTAVTNELRTAGEPAKIILSTETPTLSPGFDHVAIVRACITDKDGTEIPRANDLISFVLSGPGEIAAVDNGDNTSHEPVQATSRHAYEGRCVAFVRATVPSGQIILTATAPGLSADSITLAAAAELLR